MTYALTTKDKNYLLSIGYLQADLKQVEEGINIGTYTLCKRIKGTTEYREKEISIKKVIDRIGKKKFLASSGRASFHWSTENTIKKCSENNNSDLWGYDDITIHYDFSKLFE